MNEASTSLRGTGGPAASPEARGTSGPGTDDPGTGGPGTAGPGVAGDRSRNPCLRGLGRLVRNRMGLVGGGLLLLALTAALAAPLLTPYHFSEVDFGSPFLPPGTAGHPLGTDDLGRDVLTRLLFGVRTSLWIGLLAVGVAVGVGTPLGLLAGYSRAADAVVSRLTDVALAFPFLIIAVGLAAIRGPSLENAAIALGIANIPIIVRVVRGEALRISGLEFVQAARAMNISQVRILFQHLLPNASSVIIVQATVIIPVAIIGEAMLSFLGLGIQPPAPSLGIMLADAQEYIYRAPSAAVWPGLAIIVMCLGFNMFGDAMRDALDPNAK
ncbi:ABC transporter permease [Brevibacterium album]|uniref:ABC transporter permease n=1 Tax=Brevibacterium album TaxID=417948 RepID=UPI00040A6BE5|nr:ABC transporter permease [Brevibacterium album]